jgi:hypothetical protein
MADAYKTYDAVTDIEGTAGAPTSLSTTVEEYSATVDTHNKAGVSFTVDIQFDGSPTDDVDVKWYGSDDNSNWDDIAMGAYRVTAVGSSWQQTSFALGGTTPRYLRLGFVQTGATDSHNVHATRMTWYWTTA